MIQSTPFPNFLESPADSFLFQAFASAQVEALWTLIISDRHSPERKHSWKGASDLPSLKDYLKSCDLENPLTEEIGYCFFLKNQLIGTFHIHSVSWKNRRLEVGYWLHFEFEGQGLISKALKIFEVQFQKMGFHRIEIRCNPVNRKSCLVAERNQYALEGTLQDHEFEHGQFKNTAIYAKILPEEK